MQVAFEVDGTPAEYRRSDWSGRSQLRVGDEVVTVQSPYRLSTHFDLKTSHVWRHRVGDHEFEITKVRPRFFGGFRNNGVEISVDDHVVATATGK